MQILASAQPFGFGPASKLVGMVAQLDAVEVTFVGGGIALRYARLNGRHFVGILDDDLVDIERTRQLVRRYDSAMSVMDPKLVFACVRERRPVHFFDSLFGFWSIERTPEELTETARTIMSGSDATAEAAFHSLSVHESMVVSHLIATRSYAQSFPGVAERIADLAPYGLGSITVTGSIIDLREINRLRDSVPAVSRTLVANLGGFTNAFLDYAQRGSYIDILLRWLRRLGARTCAFDEIVVCSGAFEEPFEEVIGGVRIRAAMLPHSELLALLAAKPVYLAPPGLTSLHEAMALRVPVMLLPDQHCGHTHNRRSLRDTSLAAHAASFDGFGIDVDLPESDLEGTLALAEIAAEIDRGLAQFESFANYLDTRLEAFLGMSRETTDAYIGELEELLDGEPIADVLASMQERMDRATASL